MAEKRIALLIASFQYEDEGLSQLVAPAQDVEALAQVLEDPDIGGFEVQALVNEPVATVRRSIARFFYRKKKDDLLLLYFSGHGVLDDRGRLYLAVRDSERDFLSATAIPAAYVTDEMDNCRSKRKLLILDCCHSGAFDRTKGGPGASVGTANAFEGSGYGRVVLTASDVTQYAWEGDKAIGEPESSIFTYHLVRGLQTGEADAEPDGWITVDEWYDYVNTQMVSQTARQTPGKWSFKQQGDIIIARNPKPVVPPAEPHPELEPGHKAVSQPEGMLEREIKPMLRHNPWIWAVLAVLLIIVVALWWQVWSGRSRELALRTSITQTVEAANATATQEIANFIAASEDKGLSASAVEATVNALSTEIAIENATRLAQPAPTQASDQTPPAEISITLSAVSTTESAEPAVTTIPTPIATVTRVPTTAPDRAATNAAVGIRQTQTAEAQAAQVLAMIQASCPDGPQGEFRLFWDNHKTRLGCPKPDHQQVINYGNFAFQPFENGFMFWAELPQDVVLAVITDTSRSTWFELRGWSFVPDGAVCEFTAPAGLVQPVRAFGGVWCDNPQIREAVGWGTEQERGIGGAIQEFEGGFIIRDEDQSKAYILFRDNQAFVRESKP